MSALTAPRTTDAPARALCEILAAWREAEREIALAPPHTLKWMAASRRAERLRSEYRDRYEAECRGD